MSLETKIKRVLVPNLGGKGDKGDPGEGLSFLNFKIIEVLPPVTDIPELHFLAKVGETWVKKFSIDASDPDSAPGW